MSEQHHSGDELDDYKEQDRFLPIANVARIMKKALPDNAKIAKEAKETVQECVSEFISFITSEGKRSIRLLRATTTLSSCHIKGANARTDGDFPVYKGGNTTNTAHHGHSSKPVIGASWRSARRSMARISFGRCSPLVSRTMQRLLRFICRNTERQVHKSRF